MINRRDYAFGKINYLLLVIGFLVVIIGLFIMSGPGTTEEAYNPDIFSVRRINVAPMVCLGGFLFIIVAILWPFNRKKEIDEEAKTEEVEDK